MNKPDNHRTAPPGGSANDDCCTDWKCESGLKNNYFEGKRLTPETFRVEQRYSIERRRLLNRALYGWGVVYGYAVPTEQSSARRLRIGPGLALDECGRELLQVGVLGPELDDLILLDQQQRRVGGAERDNFIAESQKQQDSWLLSVHYAEQYLGPVTVNDPCRCEHHEWDHTCETVRYSLRPIRREQCCHDFECELTCECFSGRCCEDDDRQRQLAGGTDAPSRPFNRGGCRCLCEHLTDLPIGECGPLCEIEERCGTVRVDLRHGVPLACVELVRDDSDRWIFDPEVEACGPRRLVKRNDLLFDLIRGCDLTRISEIGWAAWHRRADPVPFADFSAAFGSAGDGKDEDEYVTKAFWVQFSRPVRANTVRPDCFAMTVMSVEHEGGWWQTLRVPIVRVDLQRRAGDPSNYVRGACIVVDGAWVEDGLRGRRSLFLAAEATVEFEVRGDLIVDCNGQTVDANTIGLAEDRTGNGAPGGTFLSTFRVAQAPGYAARAASPDTANRAKGASS